MSFCSRRALEHAEQMAGTGVAGEAYAYLPVPKRFWGDNELNDGWASPAEIQAVRAARRAGVVTRLYNPTAEEQVIVYADGRAPEALGALMQALAGRWPVVDDGGRRLAICTHGTRDRCCAKWGFAAYKAARALFDAGASPYEPMESSHLGGDRFAATGIFFPSGSMYAHLDSVDLQALAATEAAGRISPHHYRGRVFEPHLLQVIRAGLARAGVSEDAAGPLRLIAREGDIADVEADGGRRFRVALESFRVSFYGSCDELKAGRQSGARRLRVRAVEDLAEA